MATAVERVEPTAEQLRQACTRVRIPSWPADYETVMSDPLRARIVQAFAHRLIHSPRPVPAAPAPSPVAAPRTAARRVPHFSPPPGYVDHKRAASGERDD